VAAGDSARLAVQQAQLVIDECQRLIDSQRKLAANFAAAGASEDRVARALRSLAPTGWHLLEDRRWPGTARANVDLLMIGPGGVFIIDVKAWSRPRIESGRLYRDTADEQDTIDKLLAVTNLAEDALEAIGVSPNTVTPVLLFAGSRIQGVIGRVQVVNERTALQWFVARGKRLDTEQVAAMKDCLEEAFPPHVASASPFAPAVVTRNPVLARDDCDTDFEQEELTLDLDALNAALIDAEAQAPIESWMTFLHPDQLRLVRRTLSGPGRIRGPAGTGKTVVALHRAAYLASTRSGRILFTTYVKSLPMVMEGLFERLAPEHVERVEFRGLHSWAYRYLKTRAIPFNVDPRATERAWAKAWRSVRELPLFADDGVSQDYWRDEINHVVKGRGLTEFDQYANLARIGRRRPLAEAQRKQVWDLHVAYYNELRDAGVHDFNDLLALVLTDLRNHPLDDPYQAVIVDEVQDLTLLGVQLLHALVGDKPDGLLLVGDGQQSVYPGGFSLAEAGINVSGRSAILTTNYRNAAGILQAAERMVATDNFDEIEGHAETGRREVGVVRPGGIVSEVAADDQPSLELALVSAIEWAYKAHGMRHGDMAVLCAHKRDARKFVRVLEESGHRALKLDDYDGRASDAVKVGTFKRAKGLEFKVVFVPQPDAAVPTQGPNEPDDVYAERLELAHRELFVAMTRARDYLWVGTVSNRVGPD